jgi:hypothetical protein
MKQQRAHSEGAGGPGDRPPSPGPVRDEDGGLRRRQASAGRRLPADSSWRGAWFALAGSFLLHTCAVLWVWRSWGSFGRGGVLAWIDFPASLAYLRLRGGAKIAWSLVVGGLQWGVVGAALSLLIGTSARRPSDQ